MLSCPERLFLCGRACDGGRVWRLLGYVVVFHLSSAEGETGSVPSVSRSQCAAGVLPEDAQGGDDTSNMSVYILTLLANQDRFGCWLWC